MEEKEFDIVIVGGGPAGLTAGIYALRCGLSVLLIESKMIGGQATLTYEIKNFPGFESISGMELAMLIHSQAEKLGLVTEYEQVNKIDLSNKTVTCDSFIAKGKSIILAMGASARHVGVENEDRLIGAGVAYCAVCDGAFYKGEDVVLVGGGNSAIEDAIYMAKIAKSVTIVNNLDDFTCQQTLRDELKKVSEELKNITIYQSNVINKIFGDKKLEKVEIKNVHTGEMKEIVCGGMFVAIGRKPDTELIKDQIELDKYGYIVADENMHTSVEGVFVAGDIRVKKLRQIITACADGAIAATESNSYLNLIK